MDTFQGMRNAYKKKQPGSDRGNAIENDAGVDDEDRPVNPSDLETAVTEEESKLAEEFRDGGDCPGRKY